MHQMCIWHILYKICFHRYYEQWIKQKNDVFLFNKSLYNTKFFINRETWLHESFTVYLWYILENLCINKYINNVYINIQFFQIKQNIEKSQVQRYYIYNLNIIPIRVSKLCLLIFSASFIMFLYYSTLCFPTKYTRIKCKYYILHLNKIHYASLYNYFWFFGYVNITLHYFVLFFIKTLQKIHRVL